MTKEERARRVANRIQEEIAILFQREVSDPRLTLLTVTDVEVDRELAYATVYVSSLQDEMDAVIKALEGAKGFLRSQLASRIELRSFPQLRFRHDSSPNKGARIDELLAELQEERDSAEDDGS